MPRIRLSESDEWQLVDDDQDVRGREVRDESGAVLGRVDDLLLNPDEGRADALLLEDGTEIPARAVRIEADAVYVSGTAGAFTASSDTTDVTDTATSSTTMATGATSVAAPGVPPASGTAATGSAPSTVTVYDDYGRAVRRERADGGATGTSTDPA